MDAPPPPPPVLTAPVRPVVVEQSFTFDAARPYASGARRTLTLRAPEGVGVRAPCGGRVSFAGRVAARGPSITVRCVGGWRATLGQAELATGMQIGMRVTPGTTIATARTGAGITLSLRSPAGIYADPAPLLGSRPGQGPAPPAGGTASRRPPAAGRAAWKPARLPERALATPHRAPVAPPHSPAHTRVPAPVVAASLGAGVAALIAALLGSVRARRRRAGSLTAAWPATSQRRSSM